MPLTALAEIIEASGSVQPFRVIQPDQGVYVTFEFYNGDEKVDTPDRDKRGYLVCPG